LEIALKEKPVYEKVGLKEQPLLLEIWFCYKFHLVGNWKVYFVRKLIMFENLFCWKMGNFILLVWENNHFVKQSCWKFHSVGNFILLKMRKFYSAENFIPLKIEKFHFV
jgi:hypothetical protein